MSTNDRGPDSLASRIAEMEKTMDQTVTGLVTEALGTLRKEIRALDDRLTRRIDSDHKEEAANLFNLKREMTLQISGDLTAAEERITRRLDSERREQKEAVAELRREMSTQQAVQDTASFATQRVVPKENEDIGKLRASMEQISAVADNAQQDVARLAQELAEQKLRCERMEMSIRTSVPKNDDISALRHTLDRTHLLADQAQKDFKRLEKDVAEQKLRSDSMENSVQSLAAPAGGRFGVDNAELAKVLARISAEPVAQMEQKIQQQMSNMENHLVKQIEAATEEFSGKIAALDQGAYQPEQATPAACSAHLQQPMPEPAYADEAYPEYAAPEYAAPEYAAPEYAAPSPATYQQQRACYCGSIGLPVTREADIYSDHGQVSDLGLHPTSYGSVQAPLSGDYFGSLDGDGGGGYDTGGGYEEGYEQFAGDQIAPAPFAATVSYGPPTVVGFGPPVLHSVTTRMGRPMSPVREAVRESSPIRGASPVRGASPIRGMSPIRSTMQYQPRHRELSPIRARSTGDPTAYHFNPDRLASNGSGSQERDGYSHAVA
ncbi:unnamed protein product [Symbiodinium natans]|uniref:Uncharacterized protein n=1 Tax=Symbiodinium natans TaxID=878477 RepID=A0A812HR56_9DINO|nr:unnamed protein product [Symbiodinium natans]